MAAFTVGSSYLGGANVLGGGESGMNTGLDVFARGEMFPFVSSKDTSGLDYFNRGQVYPAIRHIAEEGNIVGKGGRKSWLASFLLIPAKRG